MGKVTYIIHRLIVFLLLYFSFNMLATAQPLQRTESRIALVALNSSPNDPGRLLKMLSIKKDALFVFPPLTKVLVNVQKATDTLNKQYGLDVGLQYIPLYQYAPSATNTKSAAGGELELFGKFRMPKLGDKSSLGFKVEQKHSYGNLTAPSRLHTHIGSILRTVSGYRPNKVTLAEFWVQGEIIKDRLAYRVGKIDLADINSYAFNSRKLYFLSNTFVSQPVLSDPGKSFGVAVALKIFHKIYATAGIVNANSDHGSLGINTIGRGEYFKGLEVGYREGYIDHKEDDIHVFIWQRDGRERDGAASNYGYSVLLQKKFNGLIPFVRYDKNFGNGQLNLRSLFIAGFGYHYPFGYKVGLFGAAFGLAETSVVDTRNQVIFETFYRLQLTPYTQVTPDFEFIRSSQESTHARWQPVFSLRIRVAA